MEETTNETTTEATEAEVVTEIVEETEDGKKIRTTAAAKAAPSTKRFAGVGRRKTSVARLFLTPGDGKIVVNKRAFEDYFNRETLRMLILQPVEATGNVGKFDIVVNVNGGGKSGQAGAVRHGVARALLLLNQDYRKPLNKGGFLTRDSRKVERKKYGHRKARKKSQYSKR